MMPAIQRKSRRQLQSQQIQCKPQFPTFDDLKFIAAVGLFMVTCIFCSWLFMPGSSKPAIPSAPVKERTLDEIAGVPMEERTAEEQRRLERWAEADAYFRYGVRD